MQSWGKSFLVLLFWNGPSALVITIMCWTKFLRNKSLGSSPNHIWISLLALRRLANIFISVLHHLIEWSDFWIFSSKEMNEKVLKNNSFSTLTQPMSSYTLAHRTSRNIWWDGEMPQGVRALVALTENQSLLVSTHGRWATVLQLWL